MKASIKILKKDGLVVMSNIYNNSIENRAIFSKIAENKPHTLLINNLDGNAMYYYIHKRNFPTIKKVVYFGDYTPQDVDGLYEFEETLVNNYNKKYAGDNFIFMTDKQKRYYKDITNKFKDNDINETFSILTTENAKDYFKYIQTEPTFEVIEE